MADLRETVAAAIYDAESIDLERWSWATETNEEKRRQTYEKANAVLSALRLEQHTVTHWRLQKADGIRMSFSTREVRDIAEAAARMAPYAAGGYAVYEVQQTWWSSPAEWSDPVLREPEFVGQRCSWCGGRACVCPRP